jgi:hypothetical protein
MPLRIIDNECRIEDGKLVIVIEGDNPEEVISNEGKMIALQKAAACGYPRVGINGTSGSYPVDDNGDQHDDWNQLARDGGIAAYRNEIKLMGGL